MTKKFLVILMSAIIMLCSMSFTAFADEAIVGTLGFADGSWTAQDWASSCTVTGDGTYTINANCVSGEALQAGKGVTVMTVDFKGLSKKLGSFSKKVTVSDVKVITGGGASLAIDQSKVLFGDLESNGNFRIEIYNSYGKTKDAALSPIKPSDFTFNADEQFAITFTISGLDAALAGEPEETEATTTTAATEAHVEETTTTTTVATTTTTEATTITTTEVTTTTTTVATTTTTTTEATTTTTTITTEETTTVPEETEETTEETEATTTTAETTTTTTTADETEAEITTTAATTTAAVATTAPVEQAVASDSFNSRNSSLIIVAIIAGVVIVAVIVAFVLIALKRKK